MLPSNFALTLALLWPQRSIWRRRSTAARRTRWTTWSASRCWKGSCRPCGGSWPTPWSSCRSSETFSKELRPSRTSDRPRWTNWPCSLGEDTTPPSCENCPSAHRDNCTHVLHPRAEAPSEPAAVLDTTILWTRTTKSTCSVRVWYSLMVVPELLFSNWIMMCVHFFLLICADVITWYSSYFYIFSCTVKGNLYVVSFDLIHSFAAAALVLFDDSWLKLK